MENNRTNEMIKAVENLKRAAIIIRDETDCVHNCKDCPLSSTHLGMGCWIYLTKIIGIETKPKTCSECGQEIK